MVDYIKQHLAVLALLMVLPHPVLAEPLWLDVLPADKNAAATSTQAQLPNPHKNSRRVSVSFDQLASTLATANTASAGQAQKSLSSTQIELPMPYGGLQTFNVVKSALMEAGLATKYPQIKTYKVTAVDDPAVTGVLDTGSNGFHAYLSTAQGDVFIDPVSSSTQQEYYSYYKHDYPGTAARQFACGVKTPAATESPLAEFQTQAFKALARTSDTKITYSIAVATTGEYAQAVGAGNVTNTLNEIVTAINRISFIFERDLAIQLKLIANNDQIIFTNPLTDPYTDPTDASLLIDENQAVLDLRLGNANYDIGHVLSTEGGGLALLGSACFDGYKAQGQSGHPNPKGDPFYIDIVAHEIGHQLGANHSFNGTTESCAGNRVPGSAFEPGSGTTIMSYAGLCGGENVTVNGFAVYSDATFHAGSIAEIIKYTRTGIGNNCSGTITGSVAPVASAGPDYTIPGGTPFVLTGSATDSDTAINNLTYQWDQMNAGAATTATTYGTDNGSNALFRSYVPAATPERTFPRIETIISNVANKAETLPTENRTLNFRFTARDGSGGVHEDDMQVVVNGKAGPFEIVQPNDNVILSSGLPQSIQWNAACTNAEPVNCANVDILLSTDGGQNFNTVLLASTPNSGIASVTLPTGNTKTARIKVACSDNIFFDISNTNFEINDITGGSLSTALIGGSYNCGTAKIVPVSSGGGGALTAGWLFMLLITPLLRLRQKN